MKLIEYLSIILQLLGALSVFAAAIGAVLPEGKAKTFFQLAGSRLLAASKSLSADKPEAPKVPPLPILLVLLVPLVGCAWLSKPSHYADMARILTCISAEAGAGKGPAEIALTCGQTVWITVESFTGGTAPTFTGSIDARPVFGA